jgi:hypothetical protein
MSVTAWQSIAAGSVIVEALDHEASSATNCST